MTLLKILILAIQFSIFLTVLSLGMSASVSEVFSLFRRPKKLLLALTAMYVIMPIFAILLIRLFTLNPMIELVLIAISISPIPPIFPRRSLQSGGEESFTFGLFAAISLLSVVVIPIAFTIIGIFVPESHFSLSNVIKTLLLSIILPMIVGMAIEYFASAFSRRSGAVIGKVGFILLLATFLPVLIALLPVIWTLIGNGTFLAFLVFALVGVGAGFALGGPKPNERYVLAMGTASRHPGIAVALVIANVGNDGAKLAAAAVVLYALIAAIASAPFLKWLSREK